MKPLTSEWIRKAEGDFATAEREYLAESPNYDAVAFHSQQCAEKYLKARLVEVDIPFPKTHDLSVILDLILAVEPTSASKSVIQACSLTRRMPTKPSRSPEMFVE